VDLRWNFNIENKLGVGWHQYSLLVSSPSFLLETRKKTPNFYMRVDEWNDSTVKAKGNSVVVFGSYDFMNA
jgi:hypothetical protein